MSDHKDYILGTDSKELQRLGFQHRVWSKDAFALWERAGLGQGQRILDLGCGPGFASLDLATIAGPEGKVIGVDLSPSYIEHARSRARAMGVHNCDFVQGSFDSVSLAPASFDAIYTRWVLAWINDVEGVVQRACTFLKPGGVFLCQEYLRWGTFRLVPDCPEVKTVIDACLETWRIMDSEIDIAPHLPALLRRNGMEVIHTASIGKLSRPGEMVWQWLSGFLQIYSFKLLDMGLLNAAEQAAFTKVWPRLEADADSMLIAPLVMEVMARRA